jgi:hypothetical protein
LKFSNISVIWWRPCLNEKETRENCIASVCTW